MKSIGRRSKGFIHAVEGVMASLLLMTYLVSMSPPSGQRNDWDMNTLRQTGSEYLESIGRANVSYFILEDKQKALFGINRYFFPSAVMSVTSNLPKPAIKVGVVSDYSGNPLIYFKSAPINNASCRSRYGLSSEYNCIINSSNLFGVNITLADTDGGEFNGKLDYDSIYIDMNNNGGYDGLAEGPFLENEIFQRGQDFYSVGYIDNSSKSAALWNASWTMKFRSNVLPVNVNGRDITFSFFNTNPNRPISQFDALVIAGPMNISVYENRLKRFLQVGKGLVEVSNISALNFNGLQRDIFGFDAVGYTISGNSDDATFSETSLYEAAGAADYFYATPIHTDAPLTDTSGYDVSKLSNPGSARIGRFNTTTAAVNIALLRDSSVYDTLYIDSNNDKDFSYPSSDATGYKTGTSFTLSRNTYYVRGIEPLGTYVDVIPVGSHVFANMGVIVAEKAPFAVDMSPPPPTRGHPNTLPGGKHKYGVLTEAISNISGANYNVAATKHGGIYDNFNIDLNGDGDYDGLGEGPFPDKGIVKIMSVPYSISISSDGSVVTFIPISAPSIKLSAAEGKPVIEQGKYYSVSTNNLWASFTISLNANPVLGNAASLPAGAHTYGTITQANSNIFSGRYNISATNASIAYNLLNIDFDNDGAYNGTGEGPFFGGETIKIGPESYRITVSPDGGTASFKLMERDNVPSSIANYKSGGRAIWLPDITGGGQDAWAYIRAAILWASDKKAPAPIIGKQNMVSIKRVFVSAGNMYMPYEVELDIGQ